MNLSRRTSLSLLLVSLSTVPANAALSGESGSTEVSIETVTNRTALNPLDQLLGGGNNSDLFGSVLQQHASAAQPAISTMDGHFGREGAEQPSLFGQLSPSSQTMPPALPAEAPNLSLTTAVRMGAVEQTDNSPTPLSSPTSTAPNSSYVTTTDIASNNPVTPPADTPVTPVPLPAAALLLASGLFALPVMRRLQQS